jgi:hypothetical protein
VANVNVGQGSTRHSRVPVVKIEIGNYFITVHFNGLKSYVNLFRTKKKLLCSVLEKLTKTRGVDQK